MYRFEQQVQIPTENFELPFEGKLSEDNRWVIMASLIPWREFEEECDSFLAGYASKWRSMAKVMVI
ncbi:MAG: hypothetical protein AAGG00_04015 [Cyanobacteria bacterium P01_H01_bin.150]